MYPSISLAIRFITANEIACGGWLAFHVCSGAYLIIIFFGNQAGNGHKLALVFGFNIKPIDLSRCRFGKPISRRMQILLHSMWETHDTYSTSLSLATYCAGGDLLCRSLKLVINGRKHRNIVHDSGKVSNIHVRKLPEILQRQIERQTL